MDILSAGLGIGELIGSIGAGKKARALQYKLQKQQWRREDTAFTRSVKDLTAAGLSPVLAAGVPASTSPPIAASQGIEGERQSTVDALGYMRGIADVSKSAAETKLIKEEARNKKLTNDALERHATIQTVDSSGNIVLGESQASNIEREVFFNIEKLGYETTKAQYLAEAAFFDLQQSEYNANKLAVKKSNPNISEAMLELEALALSVEQQRTQVEMNEMNLNLYRSTGLAPQLWGAALGVAQQAVPHGLYRLP